MNILAEDHLSFLPQDLIEKAKSMSKAYEYIYCIENLLRLHLITKIGNDFTQTEKVRRGIESRKQDEQNHQWIPIRGQSDIYYTDFKELIGIIDGNWDQLKSDFPDQTWIKSKLEELSRFRNMIAHNSYLENSDMELIRAYFTTIIRQLKIKSSIKEIISSSNNTRSFISGLYKSEIFSYSELRSGILYELNYSPEINVIPLSLKTSFEQIGPNFYIEYEKSRVYLYPQFTSIDIEHLEDLYEYADFLQFEIGQYDIDNDGMNELFICLRVYDKEFKIDNTIMINIFKYYPPAFHEHASRSENWELWGPFSTGTIMGEPKAEIKNNSIFISRNFRSYYDEWSFVQGEFIHKGI